MKKILTKSKIYLFSFIPVIALLGIFSLNTSSKTKATTATVATSKANVKKINPLPCGFPNYGIVGGGIPTLTTSTSPVLLLGQSVSSSTGCAKLILQGDGNLCVLVASNSGWKSVWSSGTDNVGVTRLYFQTDGNLVLTNNANQGIWHANIHSGCAGANQAYCVMQDDGNFVVRYPTGDGNAYALGDTNTGSCAPTNYCGAHYSGWNHEIKH